MPVALFQHSLDELDAGAVGDAVGDAAPWLARADARMLVRRAYGVLVEALTEAHARALSRALAARGVDVDRVDQGWLELPPVTACRRADIAARGLVLYDAYGRPRELPWSRVLLVAVGSYMVAERVAVARKPFEPEPGAVRTLLDGEGGRSPYEYVDRPQVVLDIVADVPARYRIQHQRFDYSYLGARRGPSASSNFPLLVRDLLERVPHAVLTRGARSQRSDLGELPAYPGPAQYEREMAWSLWRHLGPGTRLDGGDPYRSSGGAGPRLTEPLMRRAPAASRALSVARASLAPALTEPIASEIVRAGPRSTLARAGLAVLGGAAVAVTGWWIDPLAALLALPAVHVIFQRGRRHGQRRHGQEGHGQQGADDATPDHDAAPDRDATPDHDAGA
jgi:hypothetical protein